MTGILTPLGVLSVAAAVPLVVTAQAQITAGVGPSLAELNAKVAGLLKVSAALQLPALPAAAIAAAAAAVASLTVTLSSGGAALQVAGVASTLASLQLQIGALELLVQAAVDLGTIGAAGGVAAWAYAGTTDTLGDAVKSATLNGLPGGSATDSVNALLLATSVSATWSAMGQVLKTG